MDISTKRIFVFKTREEAQQVVQNQFQSIVNIFLCLACKTNQRIVYEVPFQIGLVLGDISPNTR